MHNKSHMHVSWLRLLLLPLLLLWADGQGPVVAAVTQCASAAVQQASRYNKVFATHIIAPRYRFEPNMDPVVEGAQRMLEAGFTSLKFDMRVHPLHPLPASTKLDRWAYPPKHDTGEHKVQLPQHALDAFDKPFETFMFWPKGAGNYYQDSKDLARYLIERHRGSNKTFLIGSWKADYIIRDWTGVGTRLHPHPNASSPIVWSQLRNSKANWNAQQAGVDAAREELKSVMQGVQVYSYLEVNLIRNGSVNFSVMEDVVPAMTSTPDYISLSLSTLPQYTNSPDPVVVASRLHPLLNHVASLLRPKQGIPGPRVFIGEFEFPLKNQYGQPNGDSWTTPTQELQAKHALAALVAGIAWGAPWVLWWELYDNTRVFTPDGKDLADLGIYQDRGLGLVSHENKDSVLYQAVKQYMREANHWLCEQIQQRGALPCRDDFRQWAVRALVDIANAIDAGSGPTHYQAPAVIPRGCA